MVRHHKLALCGAVAFGLIAVGVPVAHAQVLDDRAHMKIMKTRALLATGSTTEVYSGNRLPSREELADDIRSRTDCGAVDIANQAADSSFAGEITVVITGDIINTGNNCR